MMTYRENVLRLAAICLALPPAATSAAAQACDTSGTAVQVLGSGGPRINRERASTGYLVWHRGKGRVLVDAGGGTFLRFGQAAGRLEDLSLVAISHLHPDHVSDLPALLWLSNLARKEPLPIAGPSSGNVTPDFRTFLHRLFDEKSGAFPLLGGTLRGTGMGVPLDAMNLDAAKLEPLSVSEHSGVRVTALGVPHANVPSLAYKVQTANGTVVFGSDQTGTNPHFVTFAQGADVLVMHLTIGAGETNPLHASPSVVGQVARDANARRLVLSHIGQFDLEAAVAEVKKAYTGPVLTGADLQCVPVESAKKMGAGAVVHSAAPLPEVPIVAANDNRQPAGVLRRDTLRLNLVVQMGRWYPEAADGPFVELAVLAEAGRPPQIPAPLIRVPTGTTVVARVRNTLSDSVVWVRGLMSRPGEPDSVPVEPGESRTLTFDAGAPGTYLYSATQGVTRIALAAGDRVAENDQMSGAFIIDPAGPRPRDRILVVNIWGRRPDAGKYRNALAINGKSWPHTERFNATVGDSVRWRIVNGSTRRHPIHMHGFYFRVDSRGTLAADTAYSPESRRLAVTEDMTPLTTMSMVWSPDRPGNWLLHCHLTFHVTADARLDGDEDEHAIHTTDPMKHMAGLVVGINVNPRKGRRSEATENWKAPNVRRLRLYATERPRTGPTPLAMSYVLQRDDRPPAADSVEPPGQPIVLTRGQPTEIMVINRAHDGTAVHWHGIELESYSDGVPGWSGFGRLAPLVAPNDSFPARLTLPRAGTFIYHTHLNDVEQLTSGMYGPIIVLEPGETFDPSRDHVFTLGWDGPKAPLTLLVNGDSIAPPLVIDSSRTHRFRFVNIGAAQRFQISIKRDTALVMWRPRAKDGADLPAAARKKRPAITGLNVGETFDAEVDQLPRGEYTLTMGPRTRRIIVR